MALEEMSSVKGALSNLIHSNNLLHVMFSVFSWHRISLIKKAVVPDFVSWHRFLHNE